jgi:tripartite ATP-independent transporter DctP family solute receptor
MTLKLTRRTLIAGTAAGLAMPYVTRAQAQAKTLRFAYVNPPEHPGSIGAKKFCDLFGQKSQNRYNVRFFPSSQLGGDIQVISSLQGGTIDFTLMNADLLAGVAKDYSLFALPFLFSSGQEADKVFDGPFGDKIMALLPPKNLMGLGFFELGFRHLTNSRHEVAKMEDIAGLKIRVVQQPLYIDLFNSLGANAVPMPFPEVYTALEQKVVDGQENPVSTIFANKINEVQKFMSFTRHIYNPQILMCSKRTWDSFTDADKKAAMDTMAEARPFQRQTSRKIEGEWIEQIKKTSKVTDISVAEFQRLAEKAKPVTDKYSKDADPAMTKELFDAIKKARG